MLVYELVIEGMDAEWLAAERGTCVHVLTEQLRAAVQWVAASYEALAYGSPVTAPGLAGAVQARLAGKRG